MAGHFVITTKALEILSLTDGDRVGVAGRSLQDFISAAVEEHKDLSIHGFPVFENIVEEGKENPFGAGVYLHEEDFFTVDLEVKFNKIFLDCPCELTAEELDSHGQRYVNKMEFNQLPVKPKTSAEWVMISYAADHLPEGGKAVVVVDEEQYRNETDADLRTYFEESGIIEEVINLSGEIVLVVLKG